MNKRQRHHYYTTHRSWAKTFFFISSYFMLRHTHKNRNKNTITILAWIIKISFHNTSSLRRFALEKVTKKKKTRTNEAVNKKIQSAIGKVTSTSTSNASTYTEKLYRSLCLCQSMRIENTPRKVEWVTLYMKWGSKQKNKKSKKKNIKISIFKYFWASVFSFPPLDILWIFLTFRFMLIDALLLLFVGCTNKENSEMLTYLGTVPPTAAIVHSIFYCFPCLQTLFCFFPFPQVAIANTRWKMRFGFIENFIMTTETKCDCRMALSLHCRLYSASLCLSWHFSFCSTFFRLFLFSNRKAQSKEAKK